MTHRESQKGGRVKVPASMVSLRIVRLPNHTSHKDQRQLDKPKRIKPPYGGFIPTNSQSSSPNSEENTHNLLVPKQATKVNGFFHTPLEVSTYQKGGKSTKSTFAASIHYLTLSTTLRQERRV